MIMTLIHEICRGLNKQPVVDASTTTGVVDYNFPTASSTSLSGHNLPAMMLTMTIVQKHVPKKLLTMTIVQIFQMKTATGWSTTDGQQLLRLKSNS